MGRPGMDGIPGHDGVKGEPGKQNFNFDSTILNHYFNSSQEIPESLECLDLRETEASLVMMDRRDIKEEKELLVWEACQAHKDSLVCIFIRSSEIYNFNSKIPTVQVLRVNEVIRETRERSDLKDYRECLVHLGHRDWKVIEKPKWVLKMSYFFRPWNLYTKIAKSLKTETDHLICRFKGDGGPIGPPGLDGLPGLGGEKGDRGFAGQTGAKGDAGDVSEKGQKGEVGPPGK